MSPLSPTDPPRLTGYGAARVQRPDGSWVLFLSDDVRLVEHRDGRYEVEADDLPAPLPIDRAEVVAAAAQVANLIAARLHDARLAARVLDDAIHADTDAEAWAATTAHQATVCTARLFDGRLVCTRTDPHTVGHTYTASDAPDRHTGSEPGEGDH